MNSRIATKGEILQEFQKMPPGEEAPRTEEQFKAFLREATRNFKGRFVDFVFDRGEIDDMPRFFSLRYYLTKGDK